MPLDGVKRVKRIFPPPHHVSGCDGKFSVSVVHPETWSSTCCMGIFCKTGTVITGDFELSRRSTPVKLVVGEAIRSISCWKRVLQKICGKIETHAGLHFHELFGNPYSIYTPLVLFPWRTPTNTESEHTCPMQAGRRCS